MITRLRTACDYELLAHEQSVTNSRCVVRCAARIQTAFSLKRVSQKREKERARNDFFLVLHIVARTFRTKIVTKREKVGKGGEIFIHIVITLCKAQDFKNRDCRDKVGERV